MIVDADKVKEKLARTCDARAANYVGEAWGVLTSFAKVIRQSDLSDCAVESQAEEVENLETGNAILVDMVHRADAEIAQLKEDAERFNFCIIHQFPRKSFNPPTGKTYWYIPGYEEDLDCMTAIQAIDSAKGKS